MTLEPDTPIDLLVEMYAEGMSIGAIARETSICYSTVRNRLAAQGVEFRPRNGPHRSLDTYVIHHPQLHDETWLRARYVHERLSTVAIAREVGCSPGAVNTALRREGIQIRPRGHRSKYGTEGQ